MKIEAGPEQTFQLYGTSPAPSRDYHGLTITPELVTLNTWHVAHGPYVFPKVKKCSIEDYPYDSILQTDVINVFGDHLHFYLMDMATGECSFTTIPNKLMLKILRMLSYRDILRLSQTSKIFWELCNTNVVWKIIFNKRRNFAMNREEFRQGETIGWKSVLRSKLQSRVIQSLKKSMRGTFERPFAITTYYTKPTLKYAFNTNNTQRNTSPRDVGNKFEISTLNKNIGSVKTIQKSTKIVKTITSAHKTPNSMPKTISNVKLVNVLRSDISKTSSKTRVESCKSVTQRKISTDTKDKIKIPKILNLSKSTSKLMDKDKLNTTKSVLTSKSTVLLKKSTSKPKTDIQKPKNSISKFTK